MESRSKQFCDNASAQNANSSQYIHLALSKATPPKKLTFDQTEAFNAYSELQPYGFTVDQLTNWQGMFYPEHKKALVNLIKRGWLAADAITEVSGLNMDEAEGIAKGLTKKDLTGLNENQIAALLALGHEGLTAEHLRNWKGNHFTHAHFQVLERLIRQAHNTPQAAMAEIMELGEWQSEAIAKGFNRSDVIGLDNEMVETLIRLQGQLTSAQLRTWQGEKFYYTHGDALIYLIRQRNMSPEGAVNEINGLDGTEAGGIAQGLKRDEVIGVKERQIEALLHLRQKGIDSLTPDYLRQWQGDYFSHSHSEALIFLIEKRKLQPQEAVAELNDLDEFEARMITEHNFTCDEVKDMTGWKIDAYLKLRDYGLTPAQLRDCNGKDYFYSGHLNALIYLIKEKGMAPKHAVKEVNGLSSEQAECIAKKENREYETERKQEFVEIQSPNLRNNRR